MTTWCSSVSLNVGASRFAKVSAPRPGSAPTQNARPAPVSTTARTASSRSPCVYAAPNSVAIGPENAFNCSGRLRVIVATPSAIDSVTCASVIVRLLVRLVKHSAGSNRNARNSVTRVLGSPLTIMARTFAFTFSSHLAAPPATVWAHATSMAGVNRELFPLARMTHPPGLVSLDDVEIRPGERICRSWILAGGFLPIDYDDLTLIEVEPGRRFLERSPMLTQREWQHERIIEPAAGGCTITDRVHFVPRLGFLGALFLPMFRLAFRLRHRTLRRLFGTVS